MPDLREKITDIKFTKMVFDYYRHVLIVIRKCVQSSC